MKQKAELYALSVLMKIVHMDERDRDALPGSVMKHVKAAMRILRKRQKI